MKALGHECINRVGEVLVDVAKRIVSAENPSEDELQLIAGARKELAKLMAELDHMHKDIEAEWW